MKRAVVLLSGGVDSTTTLAAAKAEGFELYAVSFDYGQRHKIELELARRNAEKFGVTKHLIINFDLREIGGSALTSDIAVPKGVQGMEKDQCLTDNQSPIPVTYVPARNTIFLSFALAWAETLEAEDIFIGANAVDYSGYPDCRPEFIQAFEDMANLATKISVEGKVKFNIRAPLIKLAKSEIIRKGTFLGVDYSLTWSCYDPIAEPSGTLREGGVIIQDKEDRITYVPCMKCESCVLRAKGFREAGIKDDLLSHIQ
ncbi:MAG TPA: 7-cyano-7-deazaguanine synthase QueC [Nitrospiraceae bacterium]|nr:7-cyano-7-deazaguanine synthase QueC [Nitrospiraceae bacterium]